ncbi:MAG: hypothetical protein ACHQII_06120, partial [Bacteroidia bacterium]
MRNIFQPFPPRNLPPPSQSSIPIARQASPSRLESSVKNTEIFIVGHFLRVPFNRKIEWIKFLLESVYMLRYSSRIYTFTPQFKKFIMQPNIRKTLVNQAYQNIRNRDFKLHFQLVNYCPWLFIEILKIDTLADQENLIVHIAQHFIKEFGIPGVSIDDHNACIRTMLIFFFPLIEFDTSIQNDLLSAIKNMKSPNAFKLIVTRPALLCRKYIIGLLALLTSNEIEELELQISSIICKKEDIYPDTTENISNYSHEKLGDDIKTITWKNNHDSFYYHEYKNAEWKVFTKLMCIKNISLPEEFIYYNGEHSSEETSDNSELHTIYS